MKKLSIFFLLVMVIGCANSTQMQTAQSTSSPKDGELSFPSGYTSYPTFLKAVQKPKHVRDLYVNSIGAKTQKGESFPNGSILVMEIYNAETDAAGNAVKGPDGKNIKADLAKVYVMEKGMGWGKNAPMALGNGDWIFTAFTPDGKPMDANYLKCRGCHLPLNEVDFVHRYNEYFDKRG
jgi:hemoglobin